MRLIQKRSPSCDPYISIKVGQVPGGHGDISHRFDETVHISRSVVCDDTTVHVGGRVESKPYNESALGILPRLEL